MRRAIYLFAFGMAFSGLVAPPDGRADDLDVTLQKIMEAPEQVSYQGTVVEQRFSPAGDTIRSTQRIVHQRPDRDRIDVLEPDAATQRRVMIRVRDDVYRRESVGDSVVYSHRRQSGLDELDLGLDFSRLDLVRANYRLAVGDTLRMLDRPAALLTITPRHPGRRTKIAWVDTQTGLVLRVEDRDAAGALVEESFFTSLRINPLIDPALFDIREWQDRTVETNQVIACGSYTEVQREAGFTLAAPVYLPPGFMLERLRVIRFAGQPLVHFLYTDGVAQLSLFERRASPTDKAAQNWPGGVSERHGDIQVWRRSAYTVLRRYDNGKLLTVVSDIDPAESIKLIESLYPLNPPDAETPVTGNLLWAAAGAAGFLLIGRWVIQRRRMSG